MKIIELTGWDTYTSFGHTKKTCDVWYLRNNGELQIFPYLAVKDGHDLLDIEGDSIAVGRIDNKKKKISIRTPLAPGNSWALPENSYKKVK